MVQLRSKAPDGFRAVPAQDPARNDGHKIKEANDKVLPRNGICSVVAQQLHQVEV